MSMTERTIRNVFEIKDKVSPGITQIQRKVETLNKSYKTLAVTTGTVTKVGDHYEKSLSTVTAKTTFLSKRLGDLGSSMYRTGRRTMYMGFVMSSVWRRVSRAISGIVKTVGNLIKEFTSAEKASDWLGQTLQRLALGGALTGDKINDVIRIWQRWWDVSVDLGREIALLEEKFMDLRITAAESTAEFIEKVNEELDKLDWETVTAGVGAMADAFYDELFGALKDIVSDESLDDLIGSLRTIGTLSGTFMAGVIERSAEIILSLGNIVGEGGDEGTGLKGVVHWIGKVTLDLGLIAIPAVVLGAVIAGLGQIALAARLAWGAIDWIALKLGMLPLDVVIVITIVVAAMWLLDQLLKKLAKAREHIANINQLRTKTHALWEEEGIPPMAWPVPEPPAEWGGTAPGVFPSEPPMQAGGLISQTGLYRLHAGERVVSTRGRGGNTFGNITFNVYGARNPEETAQAIGRKVRTVLLLP